MHLTRDTARLLFLRGLGYVCARDLQKRRLQCDLCDRGWFSDRRYAYEALNNASRLKKNFIVVLNDNHMSISEKCRWNVGLSGESFVLRIFIQI